MALARWRSVARTETVARYNTHTHTQGPVDHVGTSVHAALVHSRTGAGFGSPAGRPADAYPVSTATAGMERAVPETEEEKERVLLLQLGRPDTRAGPGARTETTGGAGAPAPASANPTPSVSPCIRPHVCREPRWPRPKGVGVRVGTKPNTNQPNPTQPNPSAKPLRESAPSLSFPTPTQQSRAEQPSALAQHTPRPCQYSRKC